MFTAYVTPEFSILLPQSCVPCEKQIFKNAKTKTDKISCLLDQKNLAPTFQTMQPHVIFHQASPVC